MTLVARKVGSMDGLREIEFSIEHISHFIDLLPDAVLLADLSGFIINCNKACLDLLGYPSKNEVLGKLITDFIAENERSRIIRTFKENEGRTVNVNTFFSVGNRAFSADVSANLIKDSYGKPLGFIFIVKNVVSDENLNLSSDVLINGNFAEKRKMESLILNEYLFDVLMDSIPDAIYFKDVNSRFIKINKLKALRLGLKKPEEAVGKTDFDFYHEDFASEAYKDEREIIRTGKPIIGKIEEVKGKDGKTRWVSATKVPIRDGNERIIGIVGISRDITDLKMMEKKLEQINGELQDRLKKLQELQKELERSNRELENYTYVVSHDLKAPLRAIRAYISFLLEDYGDKLNEDCLGYLKRIDAAASHMSELIEDLLLLSRVGRKFMEIERVDLNEAVNEVVMDLKPIIDSKGGEVTVDKLPALYIQRVWIKQLFMNLIDNGLKFNESEKPRVEVSCEEKREEFLFKVKDNGIGIREEHLDRIFNLFERLHPNGKYEGTGAGLAICKKIVENWGGRIWAESVLGEGSTFYFTIPKKYSGFGRENCG